MAKKEGFEPSVEILNPTTVWPTAAFSRSATSPRFAVTRLSWQARCAELSPLIHRTLAYGWRQVPLRPNCESVSEKRSES